MKTTKTDVERAKQDYREAYRYHLTLGEKAWAHGSTLKALKARVEMLTEALRFGQ